MSALTILTPLAIESRAVRAGLGAGTAPAAAAGDGHGPDVSVLRIGMGPRSAARAARLIGPDPGAVVLAGFCGALAPELAPGDVVLASELRSPDGTVIGCPDPAILAGVLRRGGLRVHVGAVTSSPQLVTGARRAELARSGALAVDMESSWVAEVFAPRPPVVLRVVLDTPARELSRPWRTLSGAAIAYRALRTAAALLASWSRAAQPRELVLAAPRASCAGVFRAVEIVERALADRGAPVYVRKQIVHNAHVVAELEGKGAIFVEEIDEVPPGATAIFSAHGVSPAVREAAAERYLDVIDATCPLVAKVHAEARRFVGAGFDVVLVGHRDHEEIEGTLGETDGQAQVIESAEDVARLRVSDPERIAYLTQTTLAIDETAGVIDALAARFPRISGPVSSDICYATQNRQDAVRALATDCDLVLVVGSGNSSNSRRLVEVAQRAGRSATLIGSAAELSPELLAGAARIGVTAGASAPEHLVQQVVAAIAGLGPLMVSERTVAREDVHFKLPPEVRSPEVIH